MSLLRLATRQSPLALKQATLVKELLEQKHSSLRIEIIGFNTEADKNPKKPLCNFLNKSVFVKELQVALLEERADFAVHSVKDLSVFEQKDLTLAAVCERADARDVFISNNYKNCIDMPIGSIIGTSSPRRQSFIENLYPNLLPKNCRGNVNTRLQKLDNKEYDGLILAAAGLERLNLQHRITHYFDPLVFTPAIGQGALGIECRNKDTNTISIIKTIDHRPTKSCVMAERAVNQKLNGDCHTPIGAYAYIEATQLICHAAIASLDGKVILRTKHSGNIEDAHQIGVQCAETLLAQGAEALLKS